MYICSKGRFPCAWSKPPGQPSSLRFKLIEMRFPALFCVCFSFLSMFKGLFWIKLYIYAPRSKMLTYSVSLKGESVLNPIWISFCCLRDHVEEEGILFLLISKPHDSLQRSLFTSLIPPPPQISDIIALCVPCWRWAAAWPDAHSATCISWLESSHAGLAVGQFHLLKKHKMVLFFGGKPVTPELVNLCDTCHRRNAVSQSAWQWRSCIC